MPERGGARMKIADRFFQAAHSSTRGGRGAINFLICANFTPVIFEDPCAGSPVSACGTGTPIILATAFGCCSSRYFAKEAIVGALNIDDVDDLAQTLLQAVDENHTLN